MRMGAALATALALALSGCGVNPDYVTQSEAAVLLIVASVNGGAALDSDIRLGSGNIPPSNLICPDTILVDLAVRNKNPNAPSPNVPGAVIVERYEVRYSRSDGRGLEGVDVPHRISGKLTFPIDVATSGTEPLPIEVVRRQAKVEPPLSAIDGFDIVTVFAEIIISGRTVSGHGVSGRGSLQINFADYGESESTCPTV